MKTKEEAEIQERKALNKWREATRRIREVEAKERKAYQEYMECFGEKRNAKEAPR